MSQSYSLFLFAKLRQLGFDEISRSSLLGLLQFGYLGIFCQAKDWQIEMTIDNDEIQRNSLQCKIRLS